jgi:benzoylsuccinyl-CoA thiolase BbsB subunit
MMYAAHMGKYLGLSTRSLSLFENGGVTAGLALRFAIDAVAVGRCRAALVLAADQRPRMIFEGDFEDALRRGANGQVSLMGSYEGAFGVGAPVALYAMSGQRYMHEYNVSLADVADCVVRLRDHAVDHPHAQFRHPTTRDEVLAAKPQSPPLTTPMCCPVSSGAAAIAVTSLEDAATDGRPTARLAGIGEWHDPEHFCPVTGSMTTYLSAVNAAAQAYEEAGIGPADVDVAEIYGVFAPTEMMLYEDLGFCEKGQAADWIRAGGNTWGGDVVINPSGGRICYGHPAGATPALETIEVVRQLRGESPGKAVEGARWGMTHAEHGCLNGSIVMVFEGVSP